MLRVPLLFQGTRVLLKHFLTLSTLTRRVVDRLPSKTGSCWPHGSSASPPIGTNGILTLQVQEHRNPDTNKMPSGGPRPKRLGWHKVAGFQKGLRFSTCAQPFLGVPRPRVHLASLEMFFSRRPHDHHKLLWPSRQHGVRDLCSSRARPMHTGNLWPAVGPPSAASPNGGAHEMGWVPCGATPERVLIPKE